MITVFSEDESFHYDIHSLIQAFYPGEEIKVRGDIPAEEADYALETEVSGDKLLLSFSKPSDDDGAFDESYVNQVPSSNEKDDDLRDKSYVNHPHTPEITLPADSERPIVKSEIKRLIYRALSEWLEISLPWGTLTGIRPTKIAMDLLKQGESGEKVFSRMEDWYLASPKKAALSLEIASREKAFIEKVAHPGGYSLYIGIPFCPTRCLYCSFASNPIVQDKKTGRPKYVEEYLESLFKELEFCADMTKGRPLDSLYIGGGTPTALSEEDFERLLVKVRELYPVVPFEFTIEAGRPDSITEKKLLLMKEYGATRISVNPQTMNQATLDRIGRKHTVEQVKEAFLMARNLGFSNINMDLILGLPGETRADVEHTLKEIGFLSPDSLTVHSLAVKRASKLRELLDEEREKGGSTRESLENSESLVELAEQEARDMGLLPYYLYRQKNMAGNLENVGYARENCFGAYNVLMMEEVQDIIACGAGTISKRVYEDGRIERCDNVKELAQYLGRIDEMLERKRVLFGE